MSHESTQTTLADPAILDSELWGDEMPSPEDGRGAAAASRRVRSAADDRTDRELFYRLAVAAVGLASSVLVIRTGFERSAYCTCCSEETFGGTTFRHKPNCLAAEVTHIVEWLIRRGSLEANPQRKEEGDSNLCVTANAGGVAESPRLRPDAEGAVAG